MLALYLIELGNWKTRIKKYEHKLQVFKERGITERLAKQTAYKTDISKLDSIVRSLSTTIGAYQSFADTFDTSGIQLSGYVSDYNAEIFSRAAELIASIYAHVAEMTKHALCIDADKEALNSLIAELRSATEALREEFAQINAKLLMIA